MWALKRWFSLSAFSKSDFSWNGVQVGHKSTFLDRPDRPESGRDIIVTIWTRAFSIKSILLKRNASSSLIWPWIPSKTFPRSTLAFQVFWKIESSSSGFTSWTVDPSHRTNPDRSSGQLWQTWFIYWEVKHSYEVESQFIEFWKWVNEIHFWWLKITLFS